MTGTWTDLLRHPSPLDRLFSSVPPLRGVRLRSVTLDRSGPTVTLRVDLPGVPDLVAGKWECDTVQCQVRFLAVGGLRMSGWTPPVVVDVGLERLARRRVGVRVTGEGTRLVFVASDALDVGRVSAFRAGDDGGPHRFVRPLDARLYAGTPEPHERAFFEHL
ncbi:Imm50 family immunity protein [Streptomyces smaragdinus]|uniref:Imm50 family immunity protein n=1 Tax=Streptomyces smaragdinus TaxID=2585196 RepID=UPI0018865081|nr:Imm50 family immunity protein [Streptomyces smaragdinus]